LIFNNQNILILSPEPWGINHVSKHHYALELAHRGNNVWFLNPPTPSFYPHNVATKSISENLVLVDYDYPKGIYQLPKKIRKKIMQKQAVRLKEKLSIIPDVIWSFDPFVFQDLSVFDSNTVKIYFSVDLRENGLERELVRSANIALCTSEVIRKNLAENNVNVRVHNIGHAVAGHFFKDYPTSNQGDGKLKVGYIGNLNIKSLDSKTLLKIVSENEHIDFHFAGPNNKSNLGKLKSNSDIVDLFERENVKFHGELSSEDLPDFLMRMDILLLCYDSKLYEEQVANPHKLLEYLASGKTIASNYTKEYSKTNGLINMVDSNEKLPDLVKSIGREIDEYNAFSQRKIRINYAKDRTYRRQVDKIKYLLNT